MNPMYSPLVSLIDRLDSTIVSKTKIIRWGCPVPSFGDLSSSRVATIGINPSNREFVDESGNELQGNARRFHTMNSLGLRSWREVDVRHLQTIIESCRLYFHRNPYNNWFNKLNKVISGTSASYYDISNAACHLDLIPFATMCKWTELSATQRSLLLTIAGDTLGFLLRDSNVRILILNGMSVVQHFQEMSGVRLDRQEMPIWSLPRKARPNVVGVSFKGTVDSISGVFLGREVLVIGFNHNLQSSFGVTKDVINAIQRWILLEIKEEA
jgi:hypothetical protein